MARSGRIDRTRDSDDNRFWHPTALDDLYHYGFGLAAAFLLLAAQFYDDNNCGSVIKRLTA